MWSASQCYVCNSWQNNYWETPVCVCLSVLSIKLLHLDTTNTHSYNSMEPALKKIILTWLVAQHIHGGHKLFASLFILALLIKQTPEIHVIVWIVLRQLLNQSLEKQNQILQQNKQSLMPHSVVRWWFIFHMCHCSELLPDFSRILWS